MEGQSRHVRVPTPPKPGEVMMCQYCGQAMLPEQFSTNAFIRKREFKWQIHAKCQQEMERQCDFQTPGLIADRQNQERHREMIKSQQR